ncbi:MAG TPA: heme-binding protein [Burkholderiales bacterium]|nr:heme-binding protein [Burkholderiales bacterium]
MRGRFVALLAAALIAGCGGGSGGDGGRTVGGSAGCSGACFVATPSNLTVADVQRVIGQAVFEATARGANATVAVVDRVGNVLAVFRMPAAAPTFTISSGRGVSGGLENVNIVPSEFAAIAKALTGAYLSSEGHAFTTRTASQIVQENFNPGEINSPGGPLFGVQFSSLSCSDVVRNQAIVAAGPKGSPLGLAADPGGLPLYKNGTVVGGVGVISDAVYGLDLNVTDIDQSADELIAVAGTRGFDAPSDRRADRITVDGRSLRYVDSEALQSNPAGAPAFPPPGALIAVPGFNAAVVAAGATYGTTASGIRANADPAFAGTNSYVLDDGTGVNRYPPIAGTDGQMTQPEVSRILVEGLRVANRARGQIRRPLGATAQVSIAVVDTNGAIVGLVRTPDAAIFGIDVSVQKARSALLFSVPTAGAELTAQPPALYPTPPAASPIGQYVVNMQALIPGALTDGTAYSARAIGNLARPFFPDGINANGPGPLSKPFGSWSPFTDGLQLDLVINRVVTNLVTNAQTAPCTGLTRAPNGIQIFPGSVPIYRGATLVGAIGVSGDGIDQDDMVAFLGLANAGAALATGIGNAPQARRADQINLPGGRLRYVNCPIAPFVDSTATNVCDGL